MEINLGAGLPEVSIDVMSIEAVQEVQLMRGIMAAEFGGVISGQVNLIRKVDSR